MPTPKLHRPVFMVIDCLLGDSESPSARGCLRHGGAVGRSNRQQSRRVSSPIANRRLVCNYLGFQNAYGAAAYAVCRGVGPFANMMVLPLVLGRFKRRPKLPEIVRRSSFTDNDLIPCRFALPKLRRPFPDAPDNPPFHRRRLPTPKRRTACIRGESGTGKPFTW